MLGVWHAGYGLHAEGLQWSHSLSAYSEKRPNSHIFSPHDWLIKIFLKRWTSVDLYIVSNYIKIFICIVKHPNTIFETFGFHISLTDICRTCKYGSRMIKITPKLHWTSPALFAIEFCFALTIFTPDIIRNNYYSSKLQSGSRFHCAKCWIFRRDSPCSKEAASLRDKKTESRWGNVI